jgi:hypothetical protein
MNPTCKSLRFIFCHYGGFQRIVYREVRSEDFCFQRQLHCYMHKILQYQCTVYWFQKVPFPPAVCILFSLTSVTFIGFYYMISVLHLIISLCFPRHYELLIYNIVLTLHLWSLPVCSICRYNRIVPSLIFPENITSHVRSSALSGY